MDKYIVEAARQGKIFFGAEDEVKEDCLRQIRNDIEHAGYKEEIEQGIFQMVKDLNDGKLELRGIHQKESMPKYMSFTRTISTKLRKNHFFQGKTKMALKTR